ncbi:flagellar operon protein [Natranaerovirga hydrolytica]|uniref:Flagellar operon protein n=1 Tax=Natranaerovirga hydrolytica TaxID=680378 RepID=A0A4R1MXQ3_9FIRM|nr:TIGR02530 family flagellar biosynthesis protein [Natranaerovirga hydrolytica]TCK97895.1 flagellar operon protein [Natranaerovirga hydrolytica]
MKIQKHNFPSIEQVKNSYATTKQSSIQLKTKTSSFDALLKAELDTKTEGLKFSKHANERLEKRNIELSTNQIRRLEDSLLKANEKGIKESLVLMDNISFVINVPNQTVITAMDNESSEEQIFTNIDGAVII